MTEAVDIALAAVGLLATQGENAVRECEAVIASRRKQGDQNGVETWTLVLASVRELQASDQIPKQKLSG